MYPMKLIAPLKDYIWGGTKLKTAFGKKTDLEKVAESWQLSCHKDGSSIIENGEYAGKTLPEYIEAAGKEDNEYAMRVEGEYGKTEMWYIVDCEPGATLLYGFQHEISKEEFARRIADNTLLEVTNAVTVHKGDCFFIEAGTLHAIGKGILIAEIQQNSNTTYRIYDYGRLGNDGKPRPLHVEKAKDVTRLCPPTRPTRLEGSPVDGSAELTSANGNVSLKKGDSVFLPANFGSYKLTGSGEYILTTV